MEPLGFPQITYAASQNPGYPTGVTGWQHTGHPNLTGFQGMRAPPRQGQLAQCLSSNRVQAGRHFSRLDMECSISDCKKEHFSEAGLAKRCRGARSSWPLRWVLCPLQWEWWFLPHELAESYLPRAQHSTGPPASWSVSAPELPQQLQGLNLRPWSPASNLLESAISNATAQILLLTQDEELRRDFEQIMG